MADPDPPAGPNQDGALMQTDRLVRVDSDALSGAVAEVPEAPASSSSVGLLSTGIQVLAGPGQGKKIYFTQTEAALGVRDEVALVIKRLGDQYVAEKSDEHFIVSINGDALDDEGSVLKQDDEISFANLKVRFFVGHDLR